MKRIIHITGYSGSGKTTLGNKIKLKHDVVVYDTDIVASQIHRKLMGIIKYVIMYMSNEKRYWKKYDDEWYKWYKRVLVDVRHKDVVITGFAIDVYEWFGQNPTLEPKYSYEGYVFDVDKECTYRQRMLRDLRFLCKNRTKLERIINDGPSKLIYHLLWVEGVRNAFPAPPIDGTFTFDDKFFNKLIKERRYKRIKPDVLLNNIFSL